MFKKLIMTFIAAFAVLGFGVGTAHAHPESTVVASGSFEGRSDHVTTGNFSIVRTGSGHVLVLERDFSLDGAPAPTLGFGKDGKFEASSEFTKLESKSGLQVYQLPANIDLADFSELYVWCADFNVPLGVAKFIK